MAMMQVTEDAVQLHAIVWCLLLQARPSCVYALTHSLTTAVVQVAEAAVLLHAIV